MNHRSTFGDLWHFQNEFARRLGEHGCDTIFDGDTKPAERTVRIREAILARDLDVVIFGTIPNTSKPETYAQAFERCFGEPLKPATKRRT